VEPAQLRAVETGGGAKRVEPRPPERLVGVDVPHTRERALVEERRFERGAPTSETLAEAGGGE